MSSASDDERRLAPSMHDEELHLVRLRPWTLSFDGGASAAALEADFTAERFRAACAPLVVFCTAMCVMLVMAAAVHTNFIEGYATAFVVYALIGAGRLALDRKPDQQRARLIYGRVVIATTAVAWATILLHYASHPPVPSGGAIVAIVCLLVILPTFLRYTSLDKAQLIANLFLNSAGVASLPVWSELGRPVETLCVVGALLVGDLLALCLELLSRRAWLRLRQAEAAEDAPELAQLNAILEGLHAVDRFDLSGGWHAESVLGRGRYGVAVLLHAPALGARCVGKRIGTAGMAEGELQVLANEMEVAASLSHKYLIAFRGYFVLRPSTCCLVFEYAPGGTLGQLVSEAAKADAPFSTAEVTRWLAQLAEALRYMHSRRVVHRDVKASNIFVSREPRSEARRLRDREGDEHGVRRRVDRLRHAGVDVPRDAPRRGVHRARRLLGARRRPLRAPHAARAVHPPRRRQPRRAHVLDRLVRRQARRGGRRRDRRMRPPARALRPRVGRRPPPPDAGEADAPRRGARALPRFLMICMPIECDTRKV